MREQFLEAIVRSMGCDPSILETPGTTVASHPDRAASQITVAYRIGDHLVITCDPAVETVLTEATKNMGPDIESWSQLALEHGGKFVGAARMQLLNSVRSLRPPAPEGYSIRPLDYSDADDLALIERLIEISDTDDLDEAELELDDLDDHIECVIDETGAIASYASSRDFDMAPGFGDIGIITRSNARGRGLASVAVAAMCERLRSEGIEPLYRCDEANAGSVALSASLGFVPATMLSAFRFPLEV